MIQKNERTSRAKKPLSAEATSSKAINDGIKLVVTNYQKANEHVQNVGLMILNHSKEFGDCTGAARLVAAMPASARRAMVIDWFTKYSPISISKDGDGFKASYRQKTDKLYHEFDLDGAKANPWYDAKKKDKELEEALNLGSAKQAIYGVIKKLEGQLEKANDNDRQPIEVMLASVRLALVTTANGQPVTSKAA